MYSTATLLEKAAVERKAYLRYADPCPVHMDTFRSALRTPRNLLPHGSTYLVGDTRDAYTFINSVDGACRIIIYLVQMAMIQENYSKELRALSYRFVRVTRPDGKAFGLLKQALCAVGVFLRKG